MYFQEKMLAEVESRRLDTGYPRVVDLNDWHQLSEAGEVATALILACRDGVFMRQVIMAIRQDPRWYLAIILVEQEAWLAIDGVDGRVGEHERATPGTYSRVNLLQQLRTEESSLPERVLSFIYTRGDSVRVPQRLRGSQQYLYHFTSLSPLVEDGDANRVIRQLLREGFLEVTDVTDRCRACPQCEGDRVGFIDACEVCQSLRVKHFRMLHCFACGVVAAEWHFDQGGKMICHNCSVELKRLGKHFEYLGTGQACGDCKAEQYEEVVMARCLDCDHKYPCSESIERAYGPLGLTSEGEFQLLNRMLGVVDRFGEDCFVGPREFLTALQWESSKLGRGISKGFVLCSLSYEIEGKAELDLSFFDEVLRLSLSAIDLATKVSPTHVLAVSLSKPIEVVRQSFEDVEKELKQSEGTLRCEISLIQDPKHCQHLLTQVVDRLS